MPPAGWRIREVSEPQRYFLISRPAGRYRDGMRPYRSVVDGQAVRPLRQCEDHQRRLAPLVQRGHRAYGAIMTVNLVVLYTQPDDADGFDEHYLGVHGPLVEQIPGLERWEGARFVAAPDGGEQTYHRIAELYF